MKENTHWRCHSREYQGETFGFRFCYKKQKIAFMWAQDNTARSLSQGLGLYYYVWSKEITKAGKRFFIVATRAEFHNTYIRIPPEHRNFYEVIGENDCCRLHFDIECSRELNPDFNYESAMEIFKNSVSREFGMSFAHNFDHDMITRLMDGSMCHEMFLEMDSTNNKKNSRHLVLNMRAGFFFKNNIDVGIFVDSLMNKIHSESLFMKNSTKFADISGSENMQNTAAMRRLYVLD